jgi:hypothetical protein
MRLRHRLIPEWLVATAGSALVGSSLLVLASSANQKPGDGTVAPVATPADAEVAALCGVQCHRAPPPDVLPRAAWRDTIARMSLLRAGEVETRTTFEAHRASLPEDMRRALAYYEARAPKVLAAPEPWPAPEANGRPRFARRSVTVKGALQPGVSYLALADIAGDRRLELIAVDMRYGRALVHRPYVATDGFVELGQIPHPAHAAITDLDGDGVKDMVVSDLGSFLPADHANGAVVWMRGQPKFAPFVSAPKVTGLPRVAAVAAEDFDGDGRIDLAVAAFGWRTTGSLMLFRQQARDATSLRFDRRVLDGRTGAVDVVAADVNRDRRPDIVASFAQEHETVVAYLNEGGGRFRQETIYSAPHPNWGSSGLNVVDLDGDGDLDVVLAHGDTFDDLMVKPYHGLQWLENGGTFPFVAHTLATLPGALRSAAVDLDGDGDLDVVAIAMVDGSADATGSSLASVVWLEQVERGRFVRHTLEMGFPVHAAIAAADFDVDGDIDIVVGNFSNGGRELPGWVEIWENLTR